MKASTIRSGDKLWAAAILVEGIEVVVAARTKAGLNAALVGLRAGCTPERLKRVKVDEV